MPSGEPDLKCQMRTESGTKCRQGAGWNTPRDWGPCNDHTPGNIESMPEQLPEPIPQKGSRVYMETVDHLKRHRLYDRADQHLIVAFVLNVLKMREAYRTINEEGWIDHDPANGNRPRKHPAVKMLRDACNDIKKQSSSLGLSPNSRSQISIPDEQEDEVSEMESLLNN